MKLIFLIISVAFFVSIIGCGGAGIIWRPASAIGSFSGEKGMLTMAWDYGDEPNLAGYRIFYGTSSGKYDNCIDIGKLPKSSLGVTEYTLTGLSVGKKYFISVVAYGFPNKSSDFSQEVSGVAK